MTKSNRFVDVEDWKIVPKDVHILIPRIGQYVTLIGKSLIKDETKLRILRCGDCLGLSWAQCNHKVLITRNQKSQNQRK